jgi:hypothetical protein
MIEGVDCSARPVSSWFLHLRSCQNHNRMRLPLRFTRSGPRLLLALALAAGLAPHATVLAQPVPRAQLKVFLDCESCFADFLRSEIEFVDYVRDRTEAEVHLLITRAETASGGAEHTAAFIGAGRFAGVSETLKTVTTSSDTDDIIRRQLAATVRVGVLRFLTRDAVPPQLDVQVRLGTEDRRPAVAGDRWNNWVFSLRGSASFDGEESSRERQIGASVSADRITPAWKITLGGELDHEREEFDLDEDDPVKVERREQDFNWLVVKALGEHWSIGAEGDIESSTFDNTELAIGAAPAIEYNVFPYSMYTRRQLRALYAIGVSRVQYYEETLYGKMEETLPQHELSLTFEQRERWGSLEARIEWSQYLQDLSKSRLQANGELSVRVARGLSVASEVSASRIRDQLSLPARGATEEEILLRLRRLQSGYEYSVSVSLTYTFGSIFSSVVNPRFGQ